jgi:hypothetical protein
VEELAGVVLALLAAAVLINLVRGGWPGVKDLMRAKFLGKPAVAK